MLQWMGGSRKKVAISRKSVQKRQKQYFEQRRRQQQNVPDEARTGDYHNKRSLDILSFQDLPSVCRDDLASDSSNSLILEETKNDSDGDFISDKVVGLQLRSQRENVAQKTSLLKVVDDHATDKTALAKCEYDCGADAYKPLGKSAGSFANQKLSVFDLVGDGPISKSPMSLPLESHISFAIEGLGQLEAETPVRSPYTHTRQRVPENSSKSKVVRHANLLQDMESVLNGIEMELEDDSTWYHSNRFVNQHHKINDVGVTVFNLPEEICTSNFNTEKHCGRSNRSSSPGPDPLQWPDSTSILKDWSSDEWDDKERPWVLNTGPASLRYYTDILEDKNYELRSSTSPELWNMSAHAETMFNDIELHSVKNQLVGNEVPIITGGKRFCATPPSFDMSKENAQFDWSNIANKGAKQSTTSISEESCSTSTARRKITALPTFSSNSRYASHNESNTSNREYSFDWNDNRNTSAYGQTDFYGQSSVPKSRSNNKFDSEFDEKIGDSHWPYENCFLLNHTGLDLKFPNSERQFSVTPLRPDYSKDKYLATETDVDEILDQTNLGRDLGTIIGPRKIPFESRASEQSSGDCCTLESLQTEYEESKAGLCQKSESNDMFPLASAGYIFEKANASCTFPELSIRNPNANVERVTNDCDMVCKTDVESFSSQKLSGLSDGVSESLATSSSVKLLHESGSTDHEERDPSVEVLKVNSVRGKDRSTKKDMVTTINDDCYHSSTRMMLGSCVFQLLCIQKVSNAAILVDHVKGKPESGRALHTKEGRANVKLKATVGFLKLREMI